VLVKDLQSGAPASSPACIAGVNGSALFVASDAASGALWKSDGTPAGTVKLKQGEANRSGVLIASGAFFPGVVPTQETLSAKVGGALFFVGSDVGFDNELWKSDGTAAGTTRVKDIAPGTSLLLVLKGPICIRRGQGLGVALKV